MPKVSKAYILSIDTPISNEYANGCMETCHEVGLHCEMVRGFEKMTGRAAWLQTGIPMKFSHRSGKDINHSSEKAGCCSAGHAMIWKKITEGSDEAVIILEHDAIMLHPLGIDIPDNAIVALGYKLQDPSNYNHELAGPTRSLIKIQGHEGAHAYAITKKTAQLLIDEIAERGVLGCVDNAYFLPKQRKTKIPLMLCDPISALGWIRTSSIWSKPSLKNTQYIKSFSDNLKADSSK